MNILNEFVLILPCAPFFSLILHIYQININGKNTVQISTRPYLIQYRCFKIIRKDTFPISEIYVCISQFLYLVRKLNLLLRVHGLVKPQMKTHGVKAKEANWGKLDWQGNTTD